MDPSPADLLSSMRSDRDDPPRPSECGGRPRPAHGLPAVLLSPPTGRDAPVCEGRPERQADRPLKQTRSPFTEPEGA